MSIDYRKDLLGLGLQIKTREALEAADIRLRAREDRMIHLEAHQHQLIVEAQAAPEAAGTRELRVLATIGAYPARSSQPKAGPANRA
jgi:hypothetical protein